MTEPIGKKFEHTFLYELLNKDDLDLVEAAIKILKTNFHHVKHQVGCALKTSSGKIYTAVNIEASIYGQCAEVMAIGNALSSGESKITSIVAVKKIEDNFVVLSPCGNCRQLILDYAHNATVIFNLAGQAVKAQAIDLLPGPYENSFTTVARSGSLGRGE